MASLFAVTTTTNSLRLESGRRGEAVFTVFNASGRPIRGRARLVADPPAAQPWLSLTGEAEHDFTIAGTQQYPVKIQIPPQAPPGTYTFRLDMVGVDNPDEDYTQGPAVTFEAPAPAPPKRIPWWLIAIPVGVVLLGIIGAAIYFLTRTIPVPELAGLSISEAAVALSDAGLAVGETELITDNAVPENLVIRSEPPVGDSLRSGSQVNLIVSAGPVQVTLPNVDDRQEADARALLEAACDAPPCVIVQTQTEPNDTTESGRVIRTDPAPGTRVPQGSAVTLVVSSGPSTISKTLTATADRYWNPTFAPADPNLRPGREGPAELGELRRTLSTASDTGSGTGLLLRTHPSAKTPGMIAVQFDLSELPRGVTIEKAELELFLESGTGDESAPRILVHPATSGWSEGGTTKPNCLTSTGAGQRVGMSSGFYRWNVTKLVQAQFADPGTRFGFCIIVDGNSSLQRIFTSREGTREQRPRLTIIYRR